MILLDAECLGLSHHAKKRTLIAGFGETKTLCLYVITNIPILNAEGTYSTKHWNEGATEKLRAQV